MTMTIEKTINFIKSAHAGQKYGDMDYYLHPMQVMAEVLYMTQEEDVLMAALLHDVVEDTAYELSYISNYWGQRVADIVALVTKDDTLSYEENMARIMQPGNDDAMMVKLADNIVNSRGDKSHMSAERREKLERRYAKSIANFKDMLGVA